MKVIPDTLEPKMAKKANLTFEFVVPSEQVLASAEKLLDSNNQEERDIAKALFDTTKITQDTQAALQRSAENKGNCDLA
jgi:hypothetical protein